MEFPYTFFEDEVREGFYISGSIKHAWAAQIEILGEIDNVCKKHNIKWFAHCGTLLGAVRHGGYIPWDDDMDICMLRDDYIKFNRIAKQELPDYYEVLNMHGEEDFFEYITRVTNGHRLNFDDYYLEKYHNCPYAVGIDIFPLDYICDNKEEEENRRNLANILIEAADSIDETCLDNSELEEVVNGIEELCNSKIDRTKSIKRQLYQLTESVFSLYSSKTATEVAQMYYWVSVHDHKYPLECFKMSTMLTFENIKIPAPIGYSKILKLEYGDYMRVDKRGGIHNYPFFKGQEDYLESLLGNYPFRYKFNKEHLLVERNPIKASKRELVDFLTLLNEAHNAVIFAIRKGDTEVVSQLLVSCQNSAIRMGNIIEEDYGEGYLPVKSLEEYCEIIYEINCLLEEDKINVNVLEIIENTLAEIYNKINDNAHKYILDKKEIVFMPFKAKYWNYMESIWEEYSRDEAYDTYIVPIPYYERDAKGGFTKEHYDIDSYPADLPIINHKDIDLVKMHPDIIVIQNPYDECNYSISVEPIYYSRMLKKNTEKLIYIPYFQLDEFGPDNNKGYATMDFFCKVPGVVHSDITIVQSENMRGKYIQYLTNMAGEETAAIWQDKIKGWGISQIDKTNTYQNSQRSNLIAKVFNNKYKADDIEKILALSIGPTSVMDNNVDIMDKLEEILYKLEKLEGRIKLLYIVQPGVNELLKNAPSDFSRRYYELEDKISNLQYAVCDSDLSEEEIVSLCDGYYGDVSSLSRKFNIQNKLVMIMR